MTGEGPLLSVDKEAILLAIRATPGASRTSIGGTRRRDDGRSLLLCRVNAPAVDGAANAALIKLIAKAFGVAKSAVSVETGATGREKTVRIAGAPEALIRQLEELSRQGKGQQGD